MHFFYKKGYFLHFTHCKLWRVPLLLQKICLDSVITEYFIVAMGLYEAVVEK